VVLNCLAGLFQTVLVEKQERKSAARPHHNIECEFALLLAAAKFLTADEIDQAAN
jgi:hypothetical protein